MNEFKYQFVNLLLLVLLGVGVYWAFTTIDNGIIYDKDNLVTNQELVKNDEIGKESVVLFDNTKPQEEIKEDVKDVVVDDKEEVNKNESLINELQKLVDNKTKMDTGANGEAVGSVQKFLAEYFKDKKITVDKSFGPTTKKLVKEFQTKELNGGGGNVGPNTLTAMIAWLNK